MSQNTRVAVVALLAASACATPPPESNEPPGAAGDQPREVEVVSPVRRTLRREVRVAASVEAFEQTTLFAKAAGYLKRIHVDEGDRVRKGQVLAELEMPEAESEVAELEARAAEARAEAELERLTFDRLSRVHETDSDVISQQEVDEARAEMARALASAAVAEASQARLKAVMDYTIIKAPFAGVVTERFVDPGALIQDAASTRQATPVVTIMSSSKVRVFVYVPESAVGLVRRGTPAVMDVDALRGQRFEGSVTRYTTVLDSATRTMKVEIDFPNPDRVLLHGMYGMVTLSLEQPQDALSVPLEALADEEGETFVFCVEQGALTRRRVASGMDDGRFVEILDGLTGDERVVVGDRSGLREGMKVHARAAEEG